MDLAVESSVITPSAPGPEYLLSGSLDLTTSETQSDRRSGLANAGAVAEVATVVSRNAAIGSVRGSAAAGVPRDASTSPAKFPTHSSLFAAVTSTATGSTPPSGVEPSAPSTP